jgi:hypothetical protein
VSVATRFRVRKEVEEASSALFDVPSVRNIPAEGTTEGADLAS